MSIRVSTLSKELGTTNKVLIGFLAEKYPEFEITDYKTHHSKTISDLYKDDVRENFTRYLEAHPELTGDKKKRAAAKRDNADEPAAAKTEAPVPAPAPAPVPPPPVPAPVAAPKAPAIPPPVPAVPRAVPAAKAPVPPPPVPAVGAPRAIPAPKPAPVPPPQAPRSAPVPPPVPAHKAPAVPPVVPAPVAAPKAPATPPPVPAMPKAPAVPPPVPAMPKAPSIPPMPAVKTAPAAPIPPSAASAEASSDDSAAGSDEPRRKLSLRAPIVVRDLATALDIRPFRIISELMSMGIFAALNQNIKDEIAIKIADNHGVELEVKHREKGGAQQVLKPEPVVQRPVDDEKDKEPRCPVVCVLGHVDHGKTTLLDYYRKSNVTAGEAGGITQHVGAYTVVHNGQRITFLDTPGHAAFSKMRERGAALTDIAVLVVAADDGFMPQTDEALKFAQKNNVQIVVAINKCDAKGANVDRVKQQMQKRGITSEDWGGTVQCEAVSALKGTNMDSLLDAILLQAEVMELKANPKCPAEGVVVEAQMEQGRGPTATVIVQRGTLKTGDAFVCAQHFCRVRAILDEYGKPLKSVAPGNPGRVLGWSGVPSAGAVFSVVKNAREAEKIAEENKYKLRKAEEAEEEEAKAAAAAAQKGLSDMELLNSLLKESGEKVFKCVLKADVDGTLEALEGALLGIKSKRVKIEVVGGSVGPITPGDVNTASAAGATIVAFDVKQENSVPAMLKRVGVKVISHDIIYMLLDMVKEAMAELLDPEYKENAVGEAEVRAIFSLGKNNNVAGSMVLDGSVRRDFNARVVRKGEVLHTGKIDTLKRFKDDVTEVKAGYECGIRVTGFDDYKEGDRIECFEILEVRPAL